MERRIWLPSIYRPHFVVLVVLSLLVHVFLFSFFGIRDQFVDSRRYIAMADYLILNGHLEFSYQYFYSIPIALLAVCRAVFDDGLLAFVLFQSLLSTVAALLLYRSGTILFNANAGLFMAVIFLLWLDCIQWNTAVMTESLASSVTCMVIYVLIGFKGKPWQLFLLACLLSGALMTRPTGVLVIVGTVVFMLHYYGPFLRQRPGWGVVVYLSLTVIFLTAAKVMLNEWDFTDQYEKGNIVTYMNVLEGQPLYDASLVLDTSEIEMPDGEKTPVAKIFFFVLENPVHYIKAAFLKVFYLVSFYRPYFSTTHNLYTAMWLAVTYALFFYGLRKLPHKPLKSFAVSIILANCALVAISAADWDNRFYLPMQPGIVLVSGIGAGWVWRFAGKQTRQRL